MLSGSSSISSGVDVDQDDKKLRKLSGEIKGSELDVEGAQLLTRTPASVYIETQAAAMLFTSKLSFSVQSERQGKSRQSAVIHLHHSFLATFW